MTNKQSLLKQLQEDYPSNKFQLKKRRNGLWYLYINKKPTSIVYNKNMNLQDTNPSIRWWFVNENNTPLHYISVI